MNIEVEIDLLEHAQFVIPWQRLAIYVKAKLKKELGTEPDECLYDPKASESGVVKCFYHKGLGSLDIPFQVQIDLGLVAERFASALLQQPILAVKGYRLIGGSIWTDGNGNINVSPELP